MDTVTCGDLRGLVEASVMLYLKILNAQSFGVYTYQDKKTTYIVQMRGLTQLPQCVATQY